MCAMSSGNVGQAMRQTVRVFLVPQGPFEPGEVGVVGLHAHRNPVAPSVA